MDSEFKSYAALFKKIYENNMNLVAEKYGITSNEIAVIDYLSENKKDTAKDISKDLFFTKSHISASVKALEINGYIEKKEDSHDHKVLHLKLTSKADFIVADLKNQETRTDEVLFHGLSENEMDALKNVLLKIKDNAKELFE